MSGYIRQIQSTDGTPITAPSTVAVDSRKLIVYANDAAYEAVHGAGTQGCKYFNSTELMEREHDGTGWVPVSKAFAAVEDSTTTGANNDIAATRFDLIRFTEGSLTSIRGIDPAKHKDLRLVNDQGASFTLLNNDSGATAGQKIITGTGTDLVIEDGTTISLVYDSDSSFWRVVGGTGTGTGSGVKNYIANPDARADTSDTSSTANVTIARTTTAANLPEESKGTAFAITASGAATDGTNYAEFNSSSVWDDADARNVGSVKIKAKTTGGWKFYAYNVTDSVIAGQTSDEMLYDGEYAVDLYPTAAKDIRFRLVPTTANPAAIYVSSVTLTPESTLYGAVVDDDKPITDYDSGFSVTGFGTGNSQELRGRRVGSWLHLTGGIASGTASFSASQLTFSNLTIDTSRLQNVISFYPIPGTMQSYQEVASYNSQSYIVAASTTKNLKMFPDNNWTTQLTPSADYSYEYNLWIPILDWAGQGTLPTITDQQLQNAQGRFYMSTGPAYTANTIIPFDAISTVIDRIGVNNSSGTLSVDANGTYTVSAVINFTTSITTRLMLYKNGSLISQMSGKNTGVAHGGTATAKFLTTDTFSVRADTAGTLNPGEAICYVEVIRKSEKTGRAASLPFENDGEYGLVKTTGSAEIASGTWTPTVTNVTSAANLTGELSSYALIGTTLTMSGSFLYDSTAGGGLFEIDITIPSAYSISSGSGSAVLDISPSNTVKAESFRSASNKIRVRSRVSPTTSGQRGRFIIICTLT